MHELSLCRGLLQQVEAIAAEHGAKAVSRITLRVGPLSGVEVPLLKNAFSIARQGSVAANASLIVETTLLRIHCAGCGIEHTAESSDLRCPDCHSNETRLISGNELLLVSLAFAEKVKST